MGLGNKQRHYGATVIAGLCLSFIATHTARAETAAAAVPSNTTAATVAAAPASASTGSVIAGVDIRPSFDPASGVFRTEDAVEFGYTFKPGRSVSYLQSFTTNIHTPDKELGMDPMFDRGFIRTRLNNLITDESNGLSFGYQNRIYLPTAGYDRDAGMVSIVRNYFNLTKKVTSAVSVTLTEMPIFHINNRAGNGFGESAVANTDFQNRVYLTTDLQLTDNLSLSIPVMFHQTHHANYQPGARGNGAWDYFVWVYPEVTYALNAGTSVGLAYYSANLIKADLSDFDFEAGLSNGTVQLALTAYL